MSELTDTAWGVGLATVARRRHGARHLVSRTSGWATMPDAVDVDDRCRAGERHDDVRGVDVERASSSTIDLDAPPASAGRRVPAAAPAVEPAGAAAHGQPRRHLRAAGQRRLDQPRPGRGRRRRRGALAGARATAIVLTGARPRQVPADDRLRGAQRRAHRRRRPGAPRRPPRTRHHGDARGVRQLQRRHARARRWSRAASRAGVIVGDGSDIGGGASIMGTLSGGGTDAGHDRRALPAGRRSRHRHQPRRRVRRRGRAYVTAGTLVKMPDGEVVKARALSGASGLLYRRNSQTGAVEALPRSVKWDGLNAATARERLTRARANVTVAAGRPHRRRAVLEPA